MVCIMRSRARTKIYIAVAMNIPVGSPVLQITTSFDREADSNSKVSNGVVEPCEHPVSAPIEDDSSFKVEVFYDERR
jgi:hypothetical protein